MTGVEEKQSEWMVQVWVAGDGGWEDYWPVFIYGTSRRRAVKRAPKVFCGEFKRLHQSGKLRWRVGVMLREGLTAVDPPFHTAEACNVCGGVHNPAVHSMIGDRT